MKWIIIVASCSAGQCYDYGLDWSWWQNPKQIYYETKVECDGAKEYELEMFRKANPGRIINRSFCMPLDRWLDELPVVGDPRTDDNRRLRDDGT